MLVTGIPRCPWAVSCFVDVPDSLVSLIGGHGLRGAMLTVISETMPARGPTPKGGFCGGHLDPDGVSSDHLRQSVGTFPPFHWLKGFRGQGSYQFS